MRRLPGEGCASHSCHREAGARYNWTQEPRLEIASSVSLLACMKTLPSVNGVEFSNYILLLSFVIRHSSLEAVFPDACIRPFQGMSIFPEVSQSMNEHKVSHASLAHTSLVTEDFLGVPGSW